MLDESPDALLDGSTVVVAVDEEESEEVPAIVVAEEVVAPVVLVPDGSVVDEELAPAVVSLPPVFSVSEESDVVGPKQAERPTNMSNGVRCFIA